MVLHRFWIEFEWVDAEKMIGAGMGFGITGYDERDVIGILNELVFEGAGLPTIKKLVSDVDISNLDPRHVRPNIGNIFKRGIWFPRGYEQSG